MKPHAQAKGRIARRAGSANTANVMLAGGEEHAIARPAASAADDFGSFEAACCVDRNLCAYCSCPLAQRAVERAAGKPNGGGGERGNELAAAGE
jgi:hypothetical protein